MQAEHLSRGRETPTPERFEERELVRLGLAAERQARAFETFQERAGRRRAEVAGHGWAVADAMLRRMVGSGEKVRLGALGGFDRLDQLLAKPPKDMRKALTDWARRHTVTVG